MGRFPLRWALVVAPLAWALLGLAFPLTLWTEESDRPQAATPSVSGERIPAWFRHMELRGSVDLSFSYNFQNPKSRSTSFRLFDKEVQEPHVNALRLIAEKSTTSDSPLGFRAELLFGEDAKAIGAQGLGSPTDEFDLTEGYLELLFPVGPGVNFQVGKFVSLSGVESFDSLENWNFSDSFAFSLVEPSTHTGLRWGIPWTEHVETILGVNQGWDLVEDNNSAKTAEWQILFSPSASWSASASGLHGPEQPNDESNLRHHTDLILSITPNAQLDLKLTGYYGAEENAVSEAGKNASWRGVAAYLRYRPTKTWAIALRGEYLVDADGIRTGVREEQGVTDLRMWEATLTQEFKLARHLLARLEFRYDHTDSAVLEAGDSTDNTQETIALELIVPF